MDVGGGWWAVRSSIGSRREMLYCAESIRAD
jgi:hypothetical protein